MQRAEVSPTPFHIQTEMQRMAQYEVLLCTAYCKEAVFFIACFTNFVKFQVELYQPAVSKTVTINKFDLPHKCAFNFPGAGSLVAVIVPTLKRVRNY